MKKLHALQGLRRISDPMTAFYMKKMIDEFEDFSFDVKWGRGKKSTAFTSVKYVARALQDVSRSALLKCNAQGVSQTLDICQHGS